ncbi:membrane protease YdiL (CAAX protease family) [Catenuloplanes nepalensis]|uniref:Membrane protease YdiL (CAAX protease family) n=1 Tax=Catenuloplanes nepalensis TaxID=587533 RepID=A0ABT9MRJ0_9ACTN|nr:type II CAAX endopeptidase family protein [Catenuloplanes nepalensis]MDP9794040.1 membrane protease YdiL (CAAX protease family) [Catenuloplanes nepalensis]
MTTPAVTTGADTRRSTGPGWPELLIGLAVFATVAYGLPTLLTRTGISDRLSPLITGLLLAALSGLAGLAGFVAADRIRVRDRAAFGVRSTSARWLLLGVAGGVLALVLAQLIALAVLSFTGPAENVQAPYRDAAEGGVLSVVLSVLFLAVLTPIGEEFLFRGVVTTVLLRYGALIGVVGSSLIFALAHGLNIIFVTALVVGLITAELRRRSGSVWPGVLAHVVNNLVSQLLVVTLT